MKQKMIISSLLLFSIAGMLVAYAPLVALMPLFLGFMAFLYALHLDAMQKLTAKHEENIKQENFNLYAAIDKLAHEHKESS